MNCNSSWAVLIPFLNFSSTEFIPFNILIYLVYCPLHTFPFNQNKRSLRQRFFLSHSLPYFWHHKQTGPRVTLNKHLWNANELLKNIWQKPEESKQKTKLHKKLTPGGKKKKKKNLRQIREQKESIKTTIKLSEIFNRLNQEH